MMVISYNNVEMTWIGVSTLNFCIDSSK